MEKVTKKRGLNEKGKNQGTRPKELFQRNRSLKAKAESIPFTVQVNQRRRWRRRRRRPSWREREERKGRDSVVRVGGIGERRGKRRQTERVRRSVNDRRSTRQQTGRRLRILKSEGSDQIVWFQTHQSIRRNPTTDSLLPSCQSPWRYSLCFRLSHTPSASWSIDGLSFSRVSRPVVRFYLVIRTVLIDDRARFQYKLSFDLFSSRENGCIIHTILVLPSVLSGGQSFKALIQVSTYSGIRTDQYDWHSLQVSWVYFYGSQMMERLDSLVKVVTE